MQQPGTGLRCTGFLTYIIVMWPPNDVTYHVSGASGLRLTRHIHNSCVQRSIKQSLQEAWRAAFKFLNSYLFGLSQSWTFYVSYICRRFQLSSKKYYPNEAPIPTLSLLTVVSPYLGGVGTIRLNATFYGQPGASCRVKLKRHASSQPAPTTTTQCIFWDSAWLLCVVTKIQTKQTYKDSKLQTETT